jgi:hypothetical protein
MAKVVITNLLRGDLAEMYFRHFSIASGYAYAHAEDIGWELLHRNFVIFKLGFRRLPINVPNELSDLLVDIVRPANRSAVSPSYPFDFVTCSVTPEDVDMQPEGATIYGKKLYEFTIVEIKSGMSTLTYNEQLVMRKCADQGIRYAIYRISAIDDSPFQWDLVKEL